jgi:ABC-type nitrate/sulfonate/bicarbonate transport system substrate-binding protein
MMAVEVRAFHMAYLSVAKIVATATFFLVADFAPSLAAGAPIHIDVALGDVSLQKVPYIIAADAGIYAKNGLDVHQFITPGAARAVQSLGIAVPQEYVGQDKQYAPIEVGGGAPLIYQAGQSDAPPHRIIVATDENIVRDHIITRADVKSVQDLKGKVLGSSFNNVTGYDGVVYLRRVGLDQDVRIAAGADLASLKAGKVDAVMGTLFMAAKAPEQGFSDLDDVAKYRIPEPGSGISVDAKWLSENRDTAARFVKASVEGTAMMKKDKKIFAATLAKWFAVKDPKMVDRLFLMAQGFPDKPYPAVEGIKMAMEIYSSPAMANIKPEEFYDSSFVAALDKSGYLDSLAK